MNEFIFLWIAFWVILIGRSYILHRAVMKEIDLCAARARAHARSAGEVESYFKSVNQASNWSVWERFKLEVDLSKWTHKDFFPDERKGNAKTN